MPRKLKKSGKGTKKYKQPSIVSGMSVKEIASMDINDFNKLSAKELRLIVGRLVSAVNKRLRRFTKAGISTPATNYMESSGGMMTVKGKNVNQLRAEYARGRSFLNMETSTQAGFKAVQFRIQKTLKDRGISIPVYKMNDMFAVWNRLKELDPSLTVYSQKYKLWQDIANMPADLDIDEKIEKAQERVTELYEANIQREQEINGVSGFFELF